MRWPVSWSLGGRILTAAIAQLGRAFNATVGSSSAKGRNFERQTEEMRAQLGSLERLLGINSAVLDASLDGIRLVDLDGHTIIANQATTHLATDVFGFEANSSLEERSAILPRLSDPASFLATMKAIEEDSDCVTNDRFELADVGRSFQRMTAPVREPSGALLGRIIVLREDTAEQSAERLKTELVATVSHEVRTPLASILGFSELLLHRPADEDTRRSYLETIHSEAVRLTALVDDLLDLHKIEAGHFALASEQFNLVHVLQTEVELFTMQSTNHRLDFSTSIAPLMVNGDRKRIGQVASNLLSNAIKYSPQGGTITVTADIHDGLARVQVSDAGLGIPTEHQPRIFEKFFRADSSDTREIGGTGLGLALCREIISAHGGRISFESTQGHGSTFLFEIPASQPQTSPPQRARANVLHQVPTLLGERAQHAPANRTTE